MSSDSDPEVSDIEDLQDEVEEDFSIETDTDDEDSDEELQKAFTSGKLKPGLNIVEEKITKEKKNNVAGLKSTLQRFKLDLEWTERLDMVNSMAPLAPEIAVEIEEQDVHKKKQLKNLGYKEEDITEDLMHNDFKREMMFYRQAQAAVLEGLPKLEAAGIPTLRPEDYFAQMAKSDEHMQKVRRKLMTKQHRQELSERTRKIRQMKKFGKKVQVEVQLQKQKEKREILDKINQYRKGQTKSLDFLDEGPKKKNFDSTKSRKQAKKEMQMVKRRRDMKNQKYGYGGKKKGKKRNDGDTFNGTKGLPVMKRPGAKGKKTNKKAPRLGKARRQKVKNKG